MKRIEQERMDLMRECGLDAFARPSEDWLRLAIDAKSMGYGALSRDYERAMDIRNKYDVAMRRDQ